MSTYNDGFTDGHNVGFTNGYTEGVYTTASLSDKYGKPWIYGNIFTEMLYGAIVVIVITYLCILVLHTKGKKSLSAQQLILSIYIAVAFVLSTLQIGRALQNTTKGFQKLGSTLNIDFFTLFLEEAGCRVYALC
ncbi:hypothetical protein BDQ17DRAFT_1430201 [Cyathus striatus]|nr:hypothetical protein BDQ17DRAFT_1430201 [Cyathus striatus]